MECSTCGVNIASTARYVKFKCPGCAQTEMTRCERCKVTANTYACGCGFTGP